MTKLGEFAILEDIEEEYDYPSYKDKGYILVEIIRVSTNPDEIYRYELEVISYSGSAFWIQEGEGFDYWINEYIDLELPGFYVIEDVHGYYHRGNWSWGEDDDVDWYFGNVRRASREEVRTETVDYGKA